MSRIEVRVTEERHGGEATYRVSSSSNGSNWWGLGDPFRSKERAERVAAFLQKEWAAEAAAGGEE